MKLDVLILRKFFFEGKLRHNNYKKKKILKFEFFFKKSSSLERVTKGFFRVFALNRKKS
jgi:hypothetical protein